MSKIKILSWNVEHFKSDKQTEIANIIKSYDPDIFGIIVNVDLLYLVNT